MSDRLASSSFWLQAEPFTTGLFPAPTGSSRSYLLRSWCEWGHIPRVVTFQGPLSDSSDGGGPGSFPPRCLQSVGATEAGDSGRCPGRPASRFVVQQL